jgi:ubiquitin-protein ligase
MEIFISKDTIQRLLRDVKQIIKSPLTDNGIYYIHDDVDMLKGYAMIIGPSDTPYFGGYYFFEFKYPNNYPHSPPKVTYRTNADKIRFNPNLYTCGKVCISLLNTWRGDQWTSCQTISSVLLTLSTILCSNPLLNEPGVTKNHSDFEMYNRIIEYSNLNNAVCDIINKRPEVYMDFFESFYPFVKENFLLNYNKLLNYAKEQNEKFKEKFIVCTGYYNMKIEIDYQNIILKLENCHKLLSKEEK